MTIFYISQGMINVFPPQFRFGKMPPFSFTSFSQEANSWQKKLLFNSLNEVKG